MKDFQLRQIESRKAEDVVTEALSRAGFEVLGCRTPLALYGQINLAVEVGIPRSSEAENQLMVAASEGIL